MSEVKIGTQANVVRHGEPLKMVAKNLNGEVACEVNVYLPEDIDVIVEAGKKVAIAWAQTPGRWEITSVKCPE